MKKTLSRSQSSRVKPALIILSLTLILSSCGDGLPSEQFAKDQLNSNAKSPYEMTDFKKTNGLQGNEMGHETYQMNFHAKLVAKDSLYTFAKLGGDTLHVLKTDTTLLKSLLYRNPFQRIYWERISGMKKGEFVKEIDGKARFVKTENGWELNK